MCLSRYFVSLWPWLSCLLICLSLGQSATHLLIHSINQSLGQSFILRFSMSFCLSIYQSVSLFFAGIVCVCVSPKLLDGLGWYFRIWNISHLPQKNSEHASSNFCRPLWSGIGTKFWSVSAAISVFFWWVFNWAIGRPPFKEPCFFVFFWL